MSHKAVDICVSGSFKSTYLRMEKLKSIFHKGSPIEKYAQMGVDALMEATPVVTGRLRSSWYYVIDDKPGVSVKITWCNSDIEGGKKVVFLVDEGHATKSGKWVEGRHFIKPALEPVFQEIINGIMKEVEG